MRKMGAGQNGSGKISQSIDARSNSTHIDYDSSQIFPSTVTRPPTNGVTHIDQFTWDGNTGGMLTHTDENSVVATYEYVDQNGNTDPLGRVRKVRQASNLSTYEADSSYSYPSLAEVNTASDKESKGDGVLTSSVLYDGLGHAVRTRAANGAYVRTAYDYFGKPCAVSNPSFTDPGVLSCSASQNPSLASPGGITYYSRDALGRITLTTHPDGHAQSWAYGGNAATFTNENVYQWTQTTDSLGRITQVVEPGNLATNYTYDVLNNLLSVSQVGSAGDSARTRTFSYDSLSRLICASNPENSSASCPASNSGSYITGTTGYTYDANGNVVTKTSPAVNASSGSQTLGYCYDALNRMTYKFYSGTFNCSSPSGYAAAYSYDTSTVSVSGSRYLSGHLTEEKTYVGSTVLSTRQLYAYDPFGRIIAEQQCVKGFCTNSTPTPSLPTEHCTSLSAATGLAYCYDRAGNLTAYSNGLNSSAYPQEWILLSQTFDNGGRLAIVTANPSGSTSAQPIFTANQTDGYGPFALRHWMYGSALDVTNNFDNRLRVTNQTATVP
jgi:YD repeat-containing protein